MEPSRTSALISLQRLTSLFRSGSANGPTGRAHERHRRALLTASASLLAKGVQLITTVVTVPLTLHYLGDERFGLWMTITSILSLLSFADLGIGNGLLNGIAEAYGCNDLIAARQLISTGLALLSIMGIAALSLVFLWGGHVDWPSLFNVREEVARHDAKYATIVLLCCFAANMPLGIAQRVQFGYQEGYIANLWQAAGTIFALLGIVVAVSAHAQLTMLVLSFAGAPVIASLFSTVFEFGFRRPSLRPHLSLISGKCARRLLGLGALFFLAQLGAALVASGPNFMIARILGAEAVAPFSLAMRPIQAMCLLTSLWIVPLWPAYAEAVTRGDIGWVRQTFRRTAIAGLVLSTGAGGLFFLAHRWLLGFWVGTAHVPSTGLVTAACLYLVGNSLRWTASVCLNGAGRLCGQVIYQLGAIAILAIAFWMIPVLRSSITGIAMAFATTEIAVAGLLTFDVVQYCKQLQPTPNQA